MPRITCAMLPGGSAGGVRPAAPRFVERCGGDVARCCADRDLAQRVVRGQLRRTRLEGADLK